jgi:hypothetical protein
MELLIIVLAIGLLVGATAAPSMRAANPATQRPDTDSPPER